MLSKYNRLAQTAVSAGRQIGRFVANEAASTAIVFALALPVFTIVAVEGVDYSLALLTETKMQSVADSAALASVRELQLARTDPNSLTALANNLVDSSLQNVTTQVKVDSQALTVQVAIEKQYVPIISAFPDIQLHVSSTAKMSGSMPLCLLGLDPSAPQTIGMEQSALLTAPGCLVQSNSTSAVGVKAKDDSVMQAGMICSAGGKVQTRNANFSPAPTTDCPVLPDPLSGRAKPAVGGCDYTDDVVDGSSATLHPGVYCGGLRLTNNANVDLVKGIYVIKDGPLIVDGGASMSGTNVAFYLAGEGANLTFDTDSTIDLSAPKDGLLAGILIYDDPSGASAPAKAPKSGRGAKGRALKTGSPRQHQILSDNARNLLGTIYMPKGELIIDATKPIADKSAYTVLVVQQLHLYSGPNLVLNTDYSATDVPVPAGLGPSHAKIFLSN
jgi:Flp pilus assembly protein TadG